jgi:hypothetical protein
MRICAGNGWVSTFVGIGIVRSEDGGSDRNVGRSISISLVVGAPVSSRAAWPNTLTTGAVSVVDVGWTRDDPGRAGARPSSAGLPGPNRSLIRAVNDGEYRASCNRGGEEAAL